MTSKSKDFAIFAYLPGSLEAVPAGLLNLVEEGSNVVGASFTYGTKYIDRPGAQEIDPVSLSLGNREDIRGKQLFPPPHLTIFGGIRDAAPDAWGRRVIESKKGVPANSLPESEYLLEAGSQRVGALDVRPRIDSPEYGAAVHAHRLGYLLDAAQRIEDGLPVPANLDDIFQAGTALGGMRPKSTVIDDQGILWLAKFPSKTDRFNVPVIETATMNLAGAAGLQVPEARTRDVSAGKQVMLIRRFDRLGVGMATTRRHFVSALTLLACSEFDSPTKSYADIADAIRKYGTASRIAGDLEELFGRMVFNIFVTNDDDHLRNHGMLWDADAKGWGLSPLYDVVPRPVHSADRLLHLGVGAQGRAATLTNAMSGYARFGLTHESAQKIIRRIWAIVREWKIHFEHYGVPDQEIDKIESAFRHARDIGGDAAGL